MQSDIVAILSSSAIFDNLSEVQLMLFADICELTVHAKDEILFRERETTKEFYIIGRGGVEISLDPRLVSGNGMAKESKSPICIELRQGQVLGEIALIDQGMRSATARISANNTILLRFPHDKLLHLCDAHPELGYKFMQNLAAELASKIRNSDLTLRQYQLLLAK
ncbi:MAG: cyclic nucleotide-binding domain-containing protein [Chloroflexota bacterium]|nr:cyclic nucleotide-binding domain-containing protein [Anaerolineales bacterium]MCB8968946.1 cyclic nucleotide-binding domain-containing protein [Ardenticatenaceae bacterium]